MMEVAKISDMSIFSRLCWKWHLHGTNQAAGKPCVVTRKPFIVVTFSSVSFKHSAYWMIFFFGMVGKMLRSQHP